MTPSNSTPDPTAEGRRSPDGKTTQRNQWVVIVVLSFAVLFVIYQQVDAKIAENVATSTAQDLAAPVDKLCRQDPSARQQIGDDRCGQAAEIQRTPEAVTIPKNGNDGRNGSDGEDGKDGRGITSTAVVNGHLFVTYTDGVREDKGVIAINGQDGRGISGAALVDGSLVLTYTDGTSETVGRIVGRDGDDGRGIEDVIISADYRVIVTYTDGTVEDVGALPPGPAGPSGERGIPGRGVQTIDFNVETCEATVTYTDGFVETKPMTGCQPPTQPTTTTTDEEPPVPTN